MLKVPVRSIDMQLNAGLEDLDGFLPVEIVIAELAQRLLVWASAYLTKRGICII